MALLESSNFVLDWYDDTQTILYMKITDRWTWSDAIRGINRINETISATERDIYTIYHFAERVSMVPQGSAFTNLRSLVTVDLPNERLLFFVGINPLLRKFIDIVGGVYGLRSALEKYRFPGSLEAALNTISEHKAQQTEPGS